MRKTLIMVVALSLVALMGVALAGCSSSSSSSESKSGSSSSSSASTDSNLNIDILYEQDADMMNTYSLLAVSADAPFVDADGNAVSGVAINTQGAKAFIDWMLSDSTLDKINSYGKEQFGEQLFYVNDDAPHSTADIPHATDATKTIRISTTTSVNDSGLLGYLVPLFEQEYGYDVEVYSAGTGKSIANAEAGNADLILVHSKSQEQKFVDGGYAAVEDGYTSARLTFMHNYFVLVGPKDDPAEVSQATSAKDAFQRIANSHSKFVSRGDKSGTHTKELSLWDPSLNITDSADSVKDLDWYVYSNAGMGTCLTMANEQDAYVLSDKATFLTFKANGGSIK